MSRRQVSPGAGYGQAGRGDVLGQGGAGHLGHDGVGQQELEVVGGPQAGRATSHTGPGRNRPPDDQDGKSRMTGDCHVRILWDYEIPPGYPTPCRDSRSDVLHCASAFAASGSRRIPNDAPAMTPVWPLIPRSTMAPVPAAAVRWHRSASVPALSSSSLLLMPARLVKWCDGAGASAVLGPRHAPGGHKRWQLDERAGHRPPLDGRAGDAVARPGCRRPAAATRRPPVSPKRSAW
jgi:hypothetical protein